MPQPEVWRSEDGELYSSWLPRAHRAATFPSLEDPTVEEEYGQDYFVPQAVNFCDMVTLDIDEARDYPVLCLGNWSAEVEMATAFHVGKFHYRDSTPTIPEHPNRRYSTLIDQGRRSFYLRKVIEEYKVYTGFGDIIAAPLLSEHVGGHWSRLVYGDADDTEDDVTFAMLVHSVVGTINSSSLRWEPNQVHMVIPTRTRIRIALSGMISAENNDAKSALLSSGEGGGSIVTTIPPRLNGCAAMQSRRTRIQSSRCHGSVPSSGLI